MPHKYVTSLKPKSPKRKKIKKHNWAKHDQRITDYDNNIVDSDFDLYKPKINGLKKFLK